MGVYYHLSETVLQHEKLQRLIFFPDLQPEAEKRESWAVFSDDSTVIVLVVLNHKLYINHPAADELNLGKTLHHMFIVYVE